MRFAAPSVVCPRCGEASPPAGAGRFMTCAKCGMSLDMEAAEPRAPVRRARSEPPDIELVTAPPARRPPGHISPLVAVGVVVGIFGLAIAVAFVPTGKDYRERAERAERDEAARRHQAGQEARMRELRTAWDLLPAAQIESCRQLVETLALPCPALAHPSGPADDAEASQWLDDVLDAMSSTDAATGCTNALAALTARRETERCPTRRDPP